MKAAVIVALATMMGGCTYYVDGSTLEAGKQFCRAHGGVEYFKSDWSEERVQCTDGVGIQIMHSFH
jgi:NADPH:quinone reductase-like Zn-dependent oxidoreductase